MQFLSAACRALVALALFSVAASARQGSAVTVRVSGPIVHATVPLDPGHEWNTRACPLAIERADGTRLVTQWESVTQWPGTDDVRVAELFAVDPFADGSPYTYTVVESSQPDERVRCGPFAALWRDAPPVFVWDGTAQQSTYVGVPIRSGSVAYTQRFYGPHVFGWTTVYAGLDVVELHLIAHNGEPRTPTLYFDSLAIRDVGGFESFAPEPVASLSGVELQLVPPRPDGRLNWIEQRGWRRWHLVLHDGTEASVARAIASGAGFGVSDQWTRVGAYQAHGVPLPMLTPAQVGQAASKCVNDWILIRNALNAGTPFGMGATATDGAGRLWFRHPWGQKYGGVTGGAYRYQFAGLEVALTGQPEGLLELDARFRMLADREPVLIVDARGNPQRLEAWLDANGRPKGGWRISSADAKFDDDGGAAGLGWSKALSPIDPSLVAPDVATLAQFAPMDWQHHERAHQVAVSLAWLANDPSAKWAVAQYAELWRWREFGRLQSLLAQARAAPGLGTTIGREDGHGFSVAAAAYALGNDTWRARWRQPFADFVELCALATMPNGCVQNLNNKNNKKPPFGTSTQGDWTLSKGTETALIDGGLGAIAGAEPELAAPVAAVLRRHVIDGLLGYHWNGGLAGGAPSDYVGVRPIVWSGATFTYGAPHTDPATAPRLGADLTEVSVAAGLLAWAELRAGAITPETLGLARRLCGNSPPLAWMQSKSLYQLELDDRAPLYSALQH